MRIRRIIVLLRMVNITCLDLLPNHPHHRAPMKLLNTYDDKDEAEAAAAKLQGEKRLASERDATEVIYNLFGMPTWGNFHRLGMYSLPPLVG